MTRRREAEPTAKPIIEAGRIRFWLDVLLLPPLAFMLAVHDHVRPPRCWWER